MLETQFGKYRIDGIAGIGGMSVVYRAYDETLERDVALKVLNAQRAADEVGLRRFRREVHIAQKLTHPNIVTIYETGEVDTRAYLAMEYFPEGSLAKHFAKPVGMTLGTSAVLLREIASALDYAHANGVVHRDLKLENVLISEDGHVALSDFGIAQIMSMSSLTETGQSFGTPLYVSPEQLQGAKNVDFRTDLYSLGVIAYLLATGYFPFSGESGVAILHSHLVYDPPLPSNLNPRLPTQMDWVLNKSLAKNPQDRFASAGAMADAFAGAVSRIADVEVVILANQPTPIIPAGGTPIRNGAGESGGMDTVPIDAMTNNQPPLRSSRSLRFRVAAGLAALAVVSLVLLGLTRALIPPPNSTGDQSATVNPMLADVQATSTSTPTATLTASPTRTDTVTTSPTRTMTRTPSPTRTDTPTLTHSPTRTDTPTMTRTPSPTRTDTATRTPTATRTLTPTASPTRTPSPTRTDTATASPTRTMTRTPSPTPTRRVPTSTAVPPTHVPPTQVPPTSVPPTQVPPTSVPPTQVPPTSVPPTSVPPTNPPLIPPLVPTLICGLLC